jgi:predicted kinase
MPILWRVGSILRKHHCLMKKLLMLKGLPASGKSSWAKQYVLDQPANTWKRVCKDDLRAMLDTSRWSPGSEKLVLKIRDAIVTEALQSGSNIIVDDTNFEPKHEARLRQLAKEHGAEFEEKYFEVDVEECIIRDLKRLNSVGADVIRAMHRKYLAPPVQAPVYDATLEEAIICDLDGTICLLNGRDPYDASTCEHDLPNGKILELLTRLTSDGKKVIFVSGRRLTHLSQTVRWLGRNVIPYGITNWLLFMRGEEDNRPDYEVKQEIYDTQVKNKYNVHLVLDDRNQVVEMWRRNGLTCLQVADGNF